MQLSSDANCTVKGGIFYFAVRWRCSLARFPKRPSPSFLSESLWLSIERAFKFKGLCFDYVYIIAEVMAEMLHDVIVTAGHVIQHQRRSRCVTT